MSSLSRETKVFTVLAISMMAGVIILKLLGNNPPPAGAFCLSHYYRLEPVEKVILSRVVKSPDRWNRIEIYYSGTKSGSIEQLASLGGLASPTDINCHFIICNGLGGGDGQIQPTERWQRQWSVIPGPTRYASEQTIYICVIADGKTTHPTDFQIKRTEILVEKLSGKFSILPASIYYPGDWQ